MEEELTPTEKLADELNIHKHIDDGCSVAAGCRRKCGECYIAPRCLKEMRWFEESRWQ